MTEPAGVIDSENDEIDLVFKLLRAGSSLQLEPKHFGSVIMTRCGFNLAD